MQHTITLICFILFIPFYAHADVYLEQQKLVYRGEINQKNNQAAFDLFNAAEIKPTRLAISSGGGNVDLGMDLGEFVLRYKLDIEVTGLCFSSCANYVFVAGERKFIGPKAVIGWHGNAASAKWLDADIDAMVSEQSAKNRDEHWQKLRKHYDQVIIAAADREDKFYKLLNIDKKLLSFGHAEQFVTLAKQHGYRGWSFDIPLMEQFGITKIQTISKGWKPFLVKGLPLMIFISDE